MRATIKVAITEPRPLTMRAQPHEGDKLGGGAPTRGSTEGFEAAGRGQQIILGANLNARERLLHPRRNRPFGIHQAHARSIEGENVSAGQGEKISRRRSAHRPPPSNQHAMPVRLGTWAGPQPVPPRTAPLLGQTVPPPRVTILEVLRGSSRYFESGIQRHREGLTRRARILTRSADTSNAGAKN